MIRSKWYGILAGILFMGGANVFAANMLPSVAFFYGASAPVEQLSFYDQVVVEPSHLEAEQLAALQRSGSAVFAYLSLGEVNAPLWRQYGLSGDLIVGRNRGWNSYIMDQTRDEWQNYVLDDLIPPLFQAGYDGLFLDTLDSYQQVFRNDERQQPQRAALIDLILSIRQRYPTLKLFMNRGFDLFPEIAHVTDGMAVESLLRQFDPLNNTFSESNQDDQEWLLNKLEPVRRRDIPVTIIEYLPEYQPDQARDLADRLIALGFSPWISTPELDILGTGLFSPSPRRVLMLYNDAMDPEQSDIHALVAVIAEYLGLVPVYVHVDGALPDASLVGRYAGIISWLDSEPANPRHFQQWLGKQLDDRVPLLFMNSLPLSDPLLVKRLGLGRVPAGIKKPVTVTRIPADTEPFEADIRPRTRGMAPLLSQDDGHNVWMEVLDARQQRFTPVLLADWGGMALSPYLLIDNGLGYREWLVDPFALISGALKLEPRLIPDATTENGRRILTSHVDGDGFASRAEMPGTPYSGEVIQKAIFERYPIPHTVSIVEGETGAEGLYPWLSPELETIAQSIFRLPNVEIASHSYSHPFFWQPGKSGVDEKDTLYGYHLPIKGYAFSLRREIIGSIDYINQRLAPPDKRVKVFLWSGDARPGCEAISLTKEAGVMNMNGGNSYMTATFSSLTGLSPQGRPTSAGWQIYAPIMNENVYTNEWTGPFYGYCKVKDTFRLSESPRRIKPIAVYWHFYSGTLPASLDALEQVYDWALMQQPFPLYISEYIPRIEGFYNTVIARRSDGRWQVRNASALRTLRADPALGWPDPACSENLAGFRDLPQGRYLHLSAPAASICFSHQRPSAVYLDEANATIDHWRYLNARKVALRLTGHENIQFTVVSGTPCRLERQGKRLRPVITEQQQVFSINSKDSGDAVLVCR